jgi:photosystem II stability/assembly factor-like uncharacterized protein
MCNARIINVVSLICFYFCFAAVSVTAVSSQTITWKDVSDGIREGGLRSVAVDPDNPDTVFVSSDVAVYKSLNGGRTWDEILSFRATGNNINTIFMPVHNSHMLYLGTDDGLLRWRDSEAGWERVFSGVGSEENSVLSIAVSPEDPGRIVIGTEAGLFVSEDNGENWAKGRNLPSDTAIAFIAIDSSNPYTIYAAADKGLYKSLNGGNGWKRILDTGTADDHLLSTVEETQDDLEIEVERPIRSIAIDPSDSEIIYAATSEGLRISRDGGGIWKGAGSLGLGSLDIRHILPDGDKGNHIYAATGRGVFRYSQASDIWEELYKGMVSPEIHYLALSNVSNDGGKTLWAAAKKGVYRAEIPVQHSEGYSEKSGTGSRQENVQEIDMLSIFSNEPTIGEVREAAIQYAEVHPEKILKWRKAAAGRAWLPDVRVAYGKNKDWQSSSYFYSTSSQKYKDDDITKGKDKAWSISANWELGDLIWSSAQTSIDTRSRLVVQLRDDVLSEVTRLYFERRRRVIEMLISPPGDIAEKIESELRLQELTAGLDAMTGSYFSKKMDQGSGVRVQGTGKN